MSEKVQYVLKSNIAQSMGVSLSELFTTEEELKDVNSYDKTLMEKVRLMDALNEEEKKVLFSILDAFIGKKKLKDALSNVLKDVA